MVSENGGVDYRDVLANSGEFMEIDCANCGLDFDVQPVPVPTPGQPMPRCSCGHVYTVKELADARVGEWLNGEWFNRRNPWFRLG